MRLIKHLWGRLDDALQAVICFFAFCGAVVVIVTLVCTFAVSVKHGHEMDKLRFKCEEVRDG